MASLLCKDDKKHGANDVPRHAALATSASAAAMTLLRDAAGLLKCCGTCCSSEHVGGNRRIHWYVDHVDHVRVDQRAGRNVVELSFAHLGCLRRRLLRAVLRLFGKGGSGSES